MKKVFGVFLIFIFVVPVSSLGPTTWLIVDWHPEHQQWVDNNTTTYFSKGRIKVVTLNDENQSLPEEIKHVLKSITMSEVRVYTDTSKAPQPPNPKIEKFIRTASVDRFKNYVNQLVTFENRGTGGLNAKANSGNEKAQAWAMAQFQEMGYEPQLHCYKNHRFARECNVLAIKRGSLPSSVIVMAHLDDVGHANAGADDNASGASALLTMAQAISQVQTAHSVQFLICNGEEIGLNGSEAYAQKLKSEGSLNQVKFVINMDMVAYNSNGLFEIETNKAFEQQAVWYADLARTYTRLTPEITIPAWGSDHVSFLNENVPAVLTIEDWQTKTPCYHRACDKRESLNDNYALEIIRLNLAAVAELAGLSGISGE